MGNKRILRIRCCLRFILVNTFGIYININHGLTSPPWRLGPNFSEPSEIKTRRDEMIVAGKLTRK